MIGRSKLKGHEGSMSLNSNSTLSQKSCLVKVFNKTKLPLPRGGFVCQFIKFYGLRPPHSTAIKPCLTIGLRCWGVRGVVGRDCSGAQSKKMRNSVSGLGVICNGKKLSIVWVWKKATL